ncbi:MAG: nucleoside triphosphate pyrophosphohydrolase [Clostridia bacterium]|nr:nucleoside triphosphate pyrophosphohydrolase [Clostridia bacterium]
MKIILAGIGIEEGDISVAAFTAACKEGRKVFLRTALSLSGSYIMRSAIKAQPLDYVYERSRNLDTLAKNLASVVIKAAKTSEVVYLVDGDVASDASCRIIAAKHKDVEIINGVSRAAAIAAKANLGGNYTALSAYDIDKAALSLPLIVTDIDSEYKAGEVKLALADAFGDDIPCYKFKNGTFTEIPLYEFDRESDFDYSSAIAIKSLDFLHKSRFDAGDLHDILKALRAENGCPWDRAQTKDSIKQNAIEEIYELIDAIEKDDDEGIMEETGDVMLQAMFHILFAEERGAFTYKDAISAICTKLITRHTHIFGEDKADSALSALEIWDKNKRKEKKYENGTDYLSSVPESLPALMRAEKVSSRAEKYNFDLNAAYKPTTENLKEPTTDEAKRDDLETLKKQTGGLLLAVASLARKAGVKPEECLRIATNEFISDFEKVEKKISSDGKNMKDLSAEEVMKYYNEIKKS